MRSADPELDAAGTWVASSYLRATARDWARFGLLYLRGGTWAGAHVLPEGWVDDGRTMVSVDPEDGSPYGAHWWGVAGDTLGTFRASGYEGQSITICPPLDLVVVRLGKTPLERKANLVPWRAAVVEAFARARVETAWQVCRALRPASGRSPPSAARRRSRRRPARWRS